MKFLGGNFVIAVTAELGILLYRVVVVLYLRGFEMEFDRVARRSVGPALRIVLLAALATLYISIAMAAPAGVSSAARDL